MNDVPVRANFQEHPGQPPVFIAAFSMSSRQAHLAAGRSSRHNANASTEQARLIFLSVSVWPAMSDDLPEDDIFLESGRLRPDVVDDATARAVRESLSLARSTHWDSVRTPHLFMGLLTHPDPGVFNWSSRLGVDLTRLLEQFRDLFQQDFTDPIPPLLLNREFLSDNVIRVLRDAFGRAKDHGRTRINPMDLLIILFTAPNSIVTECFERIGVTAARLTELAVLAEQDRF